MSVCDELAVAVEMLCEMQEECQLLFEIYFDLGLCDGVESPEIKE